MNCDLLFLHAPCVRRTYKFTAWKSIPRLKSDWCIFYGKLSCTSSLQSKSFHVSLILKPTCVFVIIKMATVVKASQQREIWSFGNCPCFIAFPELCIEWCKENNLLSSSVSKTCVKTESVGKDKVPHREMDLFRDAQEKTAMDSLQSARTRTNFLTVNFPWKTISPSYHRLNFVDPDKRAHSRALKRHDGEWNEVCLVQEHPWISTKVEKYHWAYCRSLQTAINRKIPLNAPFVILNTGMEENIHFAVSQRIRKQAERTISR